MPAENFQGFLRLKVSGTVISKNFRSVHTYPKAISQWDQLISEGEFLISIS